MRSAGEPASIASSARMPVDFLRTSNASSPFNGGHHTDPRRRVANLCAHRVQAKVEVVAKCLGVEQSDVCCRNAENTRR